MLNQSTFRIVLTLSAVALSIKCTDIHYMDNFEPLKYFGRWYQVARTKASGKQTYDYVFSEYHQGPNQTIALRNWFRREDGSYGGVEGWGEADASGLPGRFKFHIEVPLSEDIITNYWIVDTDYYNWAIIYSPSTGLLKEQDTAFVLSRMVPMDHDVLSYTFAFMEKYTGLTEDMFDMTNSL